jgi:hypothetical protein
MVAAMVGAVYTVPGMALGDAYEAAAMAAVRVSICTLIAAISLACGAGAGGGPATWCAP